MPSRMDRYKEETLGEKPTRLNKNEKMYNELYTSTSFTEFTDVDSNVLELSSNVNVLNKREDYQKAKSFSSVIENEFDKKNVTDNVSYDFIEPSLKNYDINSVLEEAKKNRNNPDELEKKRKLRTVEEYDILTDLTQDKIKSYKDKKREVISEEEEEELMSLIDAVTTNIPIVHDEENSNLFDDLLPTDIDETIISSELSSELNGIANLDVTLDTEKILSNDLDSNEEQMDDDSIILENSNELAELDNIDDSFYSKSMDFSESDLDKVYDENDFNYSNDKHSNIISIVVSIVAIIIFILIVYLVIKCVL